MKWLFHRPSSVSKSFYWFVWFTIISLIIGVAVKIYVLVISGQAVSEALDRHDQISSITDATQRAAAKASMNDHGGDPLPVEVSMLGLQAIIMILTLVIYPKSLIEQFRMLRKNEGKISQKAYKSFKKEYIIFLVVFVLLDLMTTATLMYYGAKAGWGNVFTGKTIFITCTILIPTPLAIGSLVWLRKLRLAGKVESHSPLAK